MALPPLDSATIKLAARVAQAFSLTHRLAYAHIAPDLTIQHASSNFPGLLEDPVPAVAGQLLPILLWEFVGAEPQLRRILAGEVPELRLERVNREMPDGSMQYLSFHVIPVEETQPSAGLLLVAEDITHTARLEQRLVQDRNELRLVQAQLARANATLQRLNRFKSFMLSMAAHDLRSPLTAIRGYASLAQDTLTDGSPPEHTEYLAVIVAQVDRLNLLINNLLDADQIEHGRLVINPTPCNLDAIVREVSEVMQSLAIFYEVGLTVDLPPRPLPLAADQERLRQVLFNLISNAVKYTPSGGQVWVAAQVEQEQAVIRIRDNGPGMSPDQLAAIFQPYYRTDEVRRAHIPGSGLGLHIVKTIVEAHRGQVTADSVEGEGTTFTVRLPANFSSAP